MVHLSDNVQHPERQSYPPLLVMHNTTLIQEASNID